MCPVRVRPLNAREKAGDAENAWKIKKNTICSIGGERDVNLHFGEVLLSSPRTLASVPPGCADRARTRDLDLGRQLIQHQIDHTGSVRHNGQGRRNFGDGRYPW